MSRYGLFCFLGRGHLDPGLAIGRGLQARGHEVTVLHITAAQAAVRAGGVAFAALDEYEPTGVVPGAPRRHGRSWYSTVDAIMTHAARTLREAPDRLREMRAEVVVADQLDVAAGTVAERLGLPFISLSCGPPLYVDDSVPPPYAGWPHGDSAAARERNRRANALLERQAGPILDLLNARRRAWKLPPMARVNELFSTTGLITQLPACLELPRRRPAHLFYTGQFRDEHTGPRVRFDWQRLDGRPLVYASLGTVRNTSAATFRAIADACAPLDAQLVISLGGGLLRPADLGPLPGDPIVVHYAPQRALLDRAAAAVNCAGLNTTLDALRSGVPMVAIPVAEDQPGVAARLARVGAGIVLPAETLDVATLHQAMAAVLHDPRYRSAARAVQYELTRIDGRERAVDLIEALGRGSHVDPHASTVDAAPLAKIRLDQAEHQPCGPTA